MNIEPSATQFYLVGHIVDYEVFATIQPTYTPADIFAILLRLDGVEQEGRKLHEFHARLRCRENFSQLSPGATLWMRKSFEHSHAEPIMAFFCREVNEDLAETIHRICLGNLSSSNTATTLSSM
ncbi:hypothetical protein MRBLRH8O_000201 [Agrobacterium radiobacter]|uniref:hypothetical protein n=1 Tax=Agrobacterium radiobacter TaxID=362 RepID=UPI00346616EB